MEELQRIDNFILDNVDSILINLERSIIYTFDFQRMSGYKGNRKSNPFAVRWCGEKNELLYWVSGHWSPFSETSRPAISVLFNNHQERVILGH